MRRRRKFAHGGYHGDNPYLTGQQGNPYRKGGGIRRKMGHGGMMRNGECAPGEMCHGGYHHGMRRGGSVRRRYAHGGYHSNGNGINAGSPSSCIDGMGRNVPC